MRWHPAILHIEKVSRGIFGRRHYGEDGDTLIEVLIALIVLGLATVALMIAFGTSISASAEHRNLTTINSILTSASQQAISEMQLVAQQNLFASCQTGTYAQQATQEESQVPLSVLPSTDSALYTVQFVPTTGSSPYPVEWWNESGVNAGQFTSTCPSTYVNQPQMFTISLTVLSSGATYYNSFVVTLSQATSGATSTSNGPVTQLAFLSQSEPGPTGTAAGSPLLGPAGTGFTVVAENSSGVPVNTDFSNVTLSLSGGATGAMLTGCSGIEDQGFIYFTNCTISLSSATAYTIIASDPSDAAIYGSGFQDATSNPFLISAPGLSLVFIAGHQPAVAASGATFAAAGATPPEVAVENASGVIQKVSSWAGTVTLTSSGGTTSNPTLSCSGSTANTYSITFASPPLASTAQDEFTLPTSCTFSGQIRTSVGNSGSALPTSYVLFATATPTGSSSSVVSATSQPFSVSGPGTASQLVFSTQPSGSTGALATTTFPTQPAVTVEDAFGNVVYTGTGSTDSITLTMSAGAGSLTCTSNPLSATKGVATFSGCAGLNFANNLTLTAKSGTLSVTSNPFNITPLPNLLEFTTEPVAGASGTTFATEPVVAIYYSSNGLPNGTLSLVTAGTAQLGLTVSGGSLTTCSGLTPNAGVVTVQTCAFAGIAGTPYTMTATEGSVSATSSSFSPTGPGVPTQLVFTSEPTSPLISGNAFATGPVVAVEDSGGNVITTSSPTVTISSAPTGGSISSNCAALQATSGIANLATCTFTGIGGTQYDLTASLTGVTSATSTYFEVITPPLAPAAPSVTVDGPTSVTLNWAAPSSNGGEPITGYQISDTITQTSVSAADVCPSSDSSISLTCTITGLIPGDSYTFTVAGINEVGLGVFSPASTVVSLVPPGTPAAPSGTIVSPTSVTLTWAAPSDSGPPITGYQISDTNTTTSTNNTNVCAGSISSTAVTCTITGLTTNDSYTFTVAAFNVVGMGAYSPASSTFALVVPGTPTAPTAAVASPTSVTLTWAAPSDSGPPITGYQINDTNTTTSTNSTNGCAGSISSTAVTCTITGLTTGDLYTFTVAAINVVGTGAYSPPSTSLMVNVVPGTPSAPSASVASATSATLTWSAPSDSGTAVTGYQINDTNTTTHATGTNVCAGSTSSTTTACTVTGLITNDSYTFTVAAINTEGTGSFSTPSNAVALDYAGAPSTPAASVVGAASVTVSWSAPSDSGPPITGYQINDTNTTTSTNNTNVCAGSTTSTAVTCTVTGLITGDSYTFTVAAVNVVGTGTASSASPAVSLTTPNAPAAPTTAVASATSISVTWATPTNTGPAITGYQINDTNTTTSTNGTNVCASSTTSTAVTCTVTGLIAGDTYTFTVAGINVVGAGAYSPASTGLLVNAVPGTPTPPTAAGASATSITVTWSAPSDTGTAITGYQINDTNTTTSTNGINVCASSTGSTTTACTVTGLITGDSYTFTVAAINSYGTGAYSSASNAVLLVVPGTPAKPTTAVVSGTSVTVTWATPSDTGPAISGYQINDTNTTTSTPGTNVCAGSTTSTTTACTVTGLIAGDSYTFTVAAINVVGTGTYSLASTGLLVNAVPGTPAAPSAAVASTSSAALTWVAPSDTGTAITGYQINDTNTTTSANGTNVCAGSKTSTAVTCTVTGLILGDSYTFTVAAINVVGTGAYSPASTPLLVDVVPGTPNTPTSSAMGANSISVTWAAPSDTGTAITGYQINDTNTTTSTPGTNVCTGSITSTAVTCTVTGLIAGDTFTFTVAAINAEGTGAFSAASASISLVTPGTPAQPTTALAGGTSITVTWGAPSDSGPAITGYQVNDTNTTTSTLGTDVCTSATTSCTVTGLIAGDGYTFTVAAMNVVGTGGFSPASTGLTVNAVPGTPAAPTAASASTTSITVTWNTPSDTGTAITGYQVNDTNVSTSTNGTNVCTGSTTSTAVTCTVTGLIEGDSYTFTVAAINSYGTGAYSSPSTAVAAGVPNAPAQPTVSRSGSTVTVKWNAPSDTGPAITGYQIDDINTTTATNGTNVCTGSTTSTAVTCAVTGLTTTDNYTFTVAAINAAGTGPYSPSSASTRG
jgi:type II secretory pathway pseudopilin PulG